ncbi:response regulator transcription factor [Faecalicatena sp. Marseille-Q4148]|nr:response regulator transcription factor [Faecalicatena sp. Marseille-Q4148]
MEIRVALCDDEETVREYLGRLLEEWKERQNDQLQIEYFESAESFLFQYEEDKRWQLLILDIEMGKMNGVELAKKVREHNKEVQILFVTGYMDYISDGYEVEALHYLLKPVTKEKLFSVLDRARERMKKSEKALFLQGSDETVRIPYYEIRYVEVQHNYVTIHAAEDYTVKKTLSELEEELGDGFFRTGRSFLVNLKCVKRITKKEVSLKDGMVIPLSRGMYEKINRAMIRYF